MSAPALPRNLQNLVDLGHLKQAVAAQGVAESYFKRAAGARASSGIAALEAHDRFLVAYEGLFALAMGVLALYGLRPGDGEGHRAISLQAVLGVLDVPRLQVQKIVRLHDLRNLKIYRSPIPASEGDANDAVEALDLLLQLAGRAA